jgi:NitT/TauT family transport system ATP-binding protein
VASRDAATTGSTGDGATAPFLLIEDVTIQFGAGTAKAVTALERFSLAVEEREFLTIVGPSGCGKSTLLSVIDGLTSPESGRVVLRGRPLSAPGPDRAMVFQDSALFPWRTVQGNVEFGLRMRGVGASARREIARRYTALVGLEHFAHHYPHQLSGGMRQRVGIARALAVDPDILLMDEPFGALDAQTRELMGVELLKIWDQERKTVVFVTHSIDEAIYLGDRIVVMTARPGRVKQEIRIDLPRPREPRVHLRPKFTDYRQVIWDLLEEEVQAAARHDRQGPPA